MSRSAATNLLLALLLAACTSSQTAPPTEVPSMGSMTPGAGALALASDAFSEGGAIPRRFTCQGEDVSPALAWTGAPDGTASFAVIVDDPDARGWVHWVAYDIAAGVGRLAEGASGSSTFREGETTWGSIGWRGPCPPSGTHRYVFTLYALDLTIGGTGALAADDLRARMRGHVLAEARLTGTYQKG